MAHAVCTGRLQVGTGGRHRQLAQAVGHIPAHGRIAPFRRVAQAAKQIVKARKPQSCALFSSQNLRFCYRCPAFCSCVPVLCSGGQPFYFRWSGILPLVARHSASGCPQFYGRCPGPSSHSAFHVPKGSLSPSLFCFSVPNVQYYVTKAHYYHIQANIPGTRAQKPRFCAREDGKVASGIVKVAFLQITAHALKMQIPHNQIINFYQRAR